MTLIESVRTWLRTYPPLAEGRLGVDYLPEEARTFSVDTVPTTETVKRYFDGSAMKQYLFVLASREFREDRIQGNTEKPSRRLNVDAMTFDWFERSGVAWSDIEGHSWAQVQAGDFAETGPAEPVREWLAEGAMRLTERQALYIDRYYNDGLSLEAIAEEYGVSKSVISRVIKNGLARMREWVEAKRLIASCADGQGGFDWETYLSKVPVLTDRQRELMLLVLSRLPKTQGELAKKLELERSTVSRTLTRAGETVQRLAVPPGPPTSTPTIEDWEQAGKWELALQTGMGLGFCFRYCARGEQYNGLTRYNYELLRRLRAGQSVEETARELGMKVKTVRSAYGRVRRWARAGP